MPRTLAIWCAAATLLLAFACGGSSRHRAQGVVHDADPASGQVLIEHGDIPGVMPAMTMNFDVPDPALFERLVVGSAVSFTLETDGRHYRIVEVAPGAAAASADPTLFLPAAAAGREPAPAFELTDQDGGSLRLSDLRGQLVVLDFVFTECPGPCPILSATHVALQRALEPELRARTRFVSISLDPERDTPEKLRAYALARGADLSDWAFLTGPPEAVQAVVSGFGVGSTRNPDGSIDHLVATFLLDGEGRIAGRYLGLEHEAAELHRGLRALL